MIELQHLSKSYVSNQVFKDLNIKFERGVVYGVVGENGAGKTTLFNCIAGWERYEGDIVSEYQPIKNTLGFLQTNPIFLSKMTGEEYLHLVCVARGQNPSNIQAKNVFDLPLEKYAEHYSTGMKKKLALTGILLQKNEVFILDEPFNGVDMQSNLMIIKIIQKLKSLNKVIIISSHIFSTLKDSADCIIHLKDKKITSQINRAEFDALESELLSHSDFKKLENLELG